VADLGQHLKLGITGDSLLVDLLSNHRKQRGKANSSVITWGGISKGKRLCDIGPHSTVTLLCKCSWTISKHHL